MGAGGYKLGVSPTSPRAFARHFASLSNSFTGSFARRIGLRSPSAPNTPRAQQAGGRGGVDAFGQSTNTGFFAGREEIKYALISVSGICAIAAGILLVVLFA